MREEFQNGRARKRSGRKREKRNIWKILKEEYQEDLKRRRERKKREKRIRKV